MTSGLLQGACSTSGSLHQLTSRYRHSPTCLFYLKQHQPSGARLVEHPDWRLFFLPREGVERFRSRPISRACWNIMRRAASPGSLSPPRPSREYGACSSLEDSQSTPLESDLKAVPPRGSASTTICRSPSCGTIQNDEWELRREVQWARGTRLENVGKDVHNILDVRLAVEGRSMRAEGMDAVVGIGKTGRLSACPGSGHDLPRRQRLFSDRFAEMSGRTDWPRLTPKQIHRFPDESGGDVAGPLPHVQIAWTR